jgi:hypothetical protein
MLDVQDLLSLIAERKQSTIQTLPFELLSDLHDQ